MTEDDMNIDEPVQTPEFDGYWEQKGKSLNAAAILGFIIVAVIYFYAQGIIAIAAIALHGAGANTAGASHKTFLEIMTARALSTKGPIRIALISSQFIFLLLPTVWLIRRWHTKRVFEYVRLRRTPPAQILLAVTGAILFFPVSSGIANFFMHQLHFPDFLARIDSLVFASNTPAELVWVIIVVCVTPAICEETLFRGYVQRTLERSIGAKSFLVAGILFGLYHMRPLDLISLSLFGMLIGFFAYRSRSLLPSMSAHFTYNLAAVLSLYKISPDKPIIPLASFHTPLPIFFLGAAGTVVVILLYRNMTAVEPRATGPAQPSNQA